MTKLYTSTGPKRKYTRNELFGDLFSKVKIHGLGLRPRFNEIKGCTVV
jgi:hypothetical protein